MIKNLEYDNGSLIGTIELDLWNGFFNSEDTIYVVVGTKGITESAEKKHENAYSYVTENQDKILSNILNGYLAEYTDKRSGCISLSNKTGIDYFPEINSTKDLSTNLVPYCINILDTAFDNCSYVVVRFVSQLESLGDVSVLMYKDRVIGYVYNGIFNIDEYAQKDCEELIGA